MGQGSSYCVHVTLHGSVVLITLYLPNLTYFSPVGGVKETGISATLASLAEQDLAAAQQGRYACTRPVIHVYMCVTNLGL